MGCRDYVLEREKNGQCIMTSNSYGVSFLCDEMAKLDCGDGCTIPCTKNHWIVHFTCVNCKCELSLSKVV